MMQFRKQKFQNNSVIINDDLTELTDHFIYLGPVYRIMEAKVVK